MKYWFAMTARLNETFQNIQRYFTFQQGLRKQIGELSPWYQPIRFAPGLQTPAVNKHGQRIVVRSLDRGMSKWHAFVQPNLPFDLGGKRVLEIGCNAGLFLHACIQAGAREAVGIEKDSHYLGQAQFVMDAFSKLHGRYYPVRVFQGAMEELDYSMLGTFDLTLLLNVIYHIGKSDEYRGLSDSQIKQLQVRTLRNLAKISRYLMFQAIRAEKDEGRGKGRESLLELVRQAGLTVVKETMYDHPRGYILLTKSETFQARTALPVRRMVSKYFLPAHLNAEREIVDRVLDHGVENFDITQTRYYRLRTGQEDWLSPDIAHLPQDLSVPPQYWVVPWSIKLKQSGRARKMDRVQNFPNTYGKFLGLIESLMAAGYDEQAGPIPGYLLVHPKYGQVFVYTDGNHRMGILSRLAEDQPDEDLEIPVFIQQVVEREKLLDYPLTQQLIGEGYFAEEDVYKWFDNAYWFFAQDEV